jgi:hypothetical protein
MTTIVAIFDNARDVDQAVIRLARAGFEDTVFDEGILAGEAYSLGMVFAPGSAPPAVWGNPNHPPVANQITKLSFRLLSPTWMTTACPTKLSKRTR